MIASLRGHKQRKLINYIYLFSLFLFSKTKVAHSSCVEVPFNLFNFLLTAKFNIEYLLITDETDYDMKNCLDQGGCLCYLRSSYSCHTKTKTKNVLLFIQNVSNLQTW